MIKIFLKNHWLAMVFALAIGGTMIFPQLLFLKQAGNAYRGFNMFEMDDVYYYIIRTREIYDGHYQMGNFYLADGKDLPYVQPPMPEMIMAFTGKALHLEIGPVLILFRFLCPAMLFLVIYFWLLSLTGGDKKLAILAPTLVILASELVFDPRALWETITKALPQEGIVPYARVAHPQISSLFLFGFLYSFWNLLHLSHRRYMYYCILLFGFSFYIYLYTWSFLLVFLLIYLFFALLSGRRAGSVIKKIAFILAGGIAIAIPYFVNFYQLVSHPSYQALQAAYGVQQGHAPVFSKVIFLAIVMLLLLYFFRNQFLNFQSAKNRVAGFFCYFTILFLAGLAVVNQQVITGGTVWSGHYHYYIIKPLAVILAAIFLIFIFGKLHFKKVAVYGVLAVLVVFSFFNAHLVELQYYDNNFEKYLNVQKYAPLIDWLNDNVEKDKVVYTPGCFYYPSGPSGMFNNIILTYTSLNTYYGGWVPYLLSPYLDYNYYNLFMALKILGVNQDSIRQYLSENPDIFEDTSGFYFRARGLTYQNIPPEMISRAADGYIEFYKMSWQEIFAKYPLDYIIWDKNTAPNLLFEIVAREMNVAKVYDEEGIIVYKLLDN